MKEQSVIKTKEQNERKMKDQNERKMKDQNERKMKGQSLIKMKEQNERNMKEQSVRKMKEQEGTNINHKLKITIPPYLKPIYQNVLLFFKAPYKSPPFSLAALGPQNFQPNSPPKFQWYT